MPDLCENCGMAIGRLETPFVWNDHVVCKQCHDRLCEGPGAPKAGHRAMPLSRLLAITGVALLILLVVFAGVILGPSHTQEREERERAVQNALLAEQIRIDEDRRVAEELQIAQAHRLAEEQRIAEEHRLAAEQRVAEKVAAQDAFVADARRFAVEAAKIQELSAKGFHDMAVVRAVDLRQEYLAWRDSLDENHRSHDGLPHLTNAMLYVHLASQARSIYATMTYPDLKQKSWTQYLEAHNIAADAISEAMAEFGMFLPSENQYEDTASWSATGSDANR